MNRPAFLYPNTPYLSSATAAATDSYAGSSPSAMLSATEDTYWRPANVSGAKTVTIDLAEARLVDTLALLGQGLDGVTVEVRASTDGFITSNVQIVPDTVLVADVNAAWLDLQDEQTHVYRYWRLIFSTMGSAFRVAFACLCDRALLPWFEDDIDADSVEADGEHLMSAQGLYLGSPQQNAMRELRLNLGAVTDGEYFVIAHWAARCVATLNPFFLVPDTATPACLFGVVADKRFSAPYRNGLREVQSIRFLTRAR